MCSHFNAIRYWVNTLKPAQGKVFPSRACPTYEDYERGRCKKNQINFMGFEANPKNRGKFFVHLNSKRYIDGKAFYKWLLKRLERRTVDLLSFNFL